MCAHVHWRQVGVALCFSFFFFFPNFSKIPQYEEELYQQKEGNKWEKWEEIWKSNSFFFFLIRFRNKEGKITKLLLFGRKKKVSNKVPGLIMKYLGCLSLVDAENSWLPLNLISFFVFGDSYQKLLNLLFPSLNSPSSPTFLCMSCSRSQIIFVAFLLTFSICLLGVWWEAKHKQEELKYLIFSVDLCVVFVFPW